MTGRPIIVRGTQDYWFLARELPGGVQFDVENFSSLTEARDWCGRHATPMRVKVGSDVLNERQVACLLAISDGPVRIAATAACADVPIASARRCVESLASAGFVSVSDPVRRQRVGDRVVALTERGQGVVGRHAP